MKLGFSRQISKKYANIKFHENPVIGARIIPCGRSDMTKLIVTLRNFTKEPNNSQYTLYRYRGNRFCSRKRPDRLWGPHRPPCSGYLELLPGEQSGRWVKLPTRLYLVPWLRIRGSIPPLSRMFSKHDAWLSIGKTLPFKTFSVKFTSSSGVEIAWEICLCACL